MCMSILVKNMRTCNKNKKAKNIYITTFLLGH